MFATLLVDPATHKHALSIINKSSHLRWWNQVRILQQEKIRKSSSKVCPIDISVLRRARVVDLLASRTEHVHRESAREVREPCGKHRLALAVGSRAATEVSTLKFLILQTAMR